MLEDYINYLSSLQNCLSRSGIQIPVDKNSYSGVLSSVNAYEDFLFLNDILAVSGSENKITILNYDDKVLFTELMKSELLVKNTMILQNQGTPEGTQPIDTLKSGRKVIPSVVQLRKNENFKDLKIFDSSDTNDEFSAFDCRDDAMTAFNKSLQLSRQVTADEDITNGEDINEDMDNLYELYGLGTQKSVSNASEDDCDADTEFDASLYTTEEDDEDDDEDYDLDSEYNEEDYASSDEDEEDDDEDYDSYFELESSAEESSDDEDEEDDDEDYDSYFEGTSDVEEESDDDEDDDDEDAGYDSYYEEESSGDEDEDDEDYDSYFDGESDAELADSNEDEDDDDEDEGYNSYCSDDEEDSSIEDEDDDDDFAGYDSEEENSSIEDNEDDEDDDDDFAGYDSEYETEASEDSNNEDEDDDDDFAGYDSEDSENDSTETEDDDDEDEDYDDYYPSNEETKSVSADSVSNSRDRIKSSVNKQNSMITDDDFFDGESLDVSDICVEEEDDGSFDFSVRKPVESNSESIQDRLSVNEPAKTSGTACDSDVALADALTKGVDYMFKGLKKLTKHVGKSLVRPDEDNK